MGWKIDIETVPLVRPHTKSEFCSSGHARKKIHNLLDLTNYECNANSVPDYSGMLGSCLMSQASGLPDKYRCNHCGTLFEMECIHAIC